MSRRAILAAIFVASFVAGCVPEKKIFWSPDGSTAAILGRDQLFFCDGTGKLLASARGKYTGVSWYPDNQRVAVVYAKPLAKWDEVAKYMTPEKQKQTIEDSEGLFKDFMAYKGDWKDFKPTREVKDWSPALVYMRDKHAEELKTKPNIPKELMTANKDLFQLLVINWHDLPAWGKPPPATTSTALKAARARRDTGGTWRFRRQSRRKGRRLPRRRRRRPRIPATCPWPREAHHAQHRLLAKFGLVARWQGPVLRHALRSEVP